MCPIVPIFRCGLLRSNFSFAIVSSPHGRGLHASLEAFSLNVEPAPDKRRLYLEPAPSDQFVWSGGPDLNRQPSPWKSETLPLSYPRPACPIKSLRAPRRARTRDLWSLGPGLNR